MVGNIIKGRTAGWLLRVAVVWGAAVLAAGCTTECVVTETQCEVCF